MELFWCCWIIQFFLIIEWFCAPKQHTCTFGFIDVHTHYMYYYQVHITFSGVLPNSLKNVAMIFSFMVNIPSDWIYFWYVQIGAEVYSLLLEFFYTVSKAVCCNQGLQLVSKIFWSVNFEGARLITSRHQSLPQKSYRIL